LQPAIAASCKRPTLFSDFAINNVHAVEAIFQRDMHFYERK
jgi:hypothetical protein